MSSPDIENVICHVTVAVHALEPMSKLEHAIIWNARNTIVGSENTKKQENGRVENGPNGQIIHHALEHVVVAGNQGGKKSELTWKHNLETRLWTWKHNYLTWKHQYYVGNIIFISKRYLLIWVNSDVSKLIVEFPSQYLCFQVTFPTIIVSFIC